MNTSLAEFSLLIYYNRHQKQNFFTKLFIQILFKVYFDSIFWVFQFSIPSRLINLYKPCFKVQYIQHNQVTRKIYLRY